jgi:predicted ATP-dependent endonuclease of OLD family
VELYQVDVCGYRKFKSATHLKTRGKIVSILGSNEAGKSSLLRAIERLDDDEPYREEEKSHNLGKGKLLIKARFLLSDDDRLAAGAPNAIWLFLHKESDGIRRWAFEPSIASRDIVHRTRLHKNISDISNKPKLAQKLIDAEETLLADALSILSKIEQLETDLDSETISLLQQVTERFEAAIDDSFPVLLQRFRDALVAGVSVETLENAYLKAGGILRGRIPEFLFFGEDDRNLKSAYSMTDLAENIPNALSNLAKVANLDLKKLLKLYGKNISDPDIDTLVDSANDSLKEKFQAVWKQSAISVVISLRDQQLLVQIRNKDNRRTDFAQRSDGLRQFVALQCFTTSIESDNIVLLIDEAEQHLHYDAQADLIQMLARQTVAQKVIYSTHSAGCLPEDMGNGVRLIQETALGSEWSKVENKFWNSKGLTFSPLLIGMGASTLAFFPTRTAVVVEGYSDMLLYPTIFREVLKATSLGCQFVPGLSESNGQQLPLLNSSGKKVCYLVDGDQGGKDLAAALEGLGVEPSKILCLMHTKGDCELEDFIDKRLLTEAVNQIGKLHCQDANLVTFARMPDFGRWKYVERCCNAKVIEIPSKVEVAYAMLDIVESDPSRQIVDKNKKDIFVGLASKISNILGVEIGAQGIAT